MKTALTKKQHNALDNLIAEIYRKNCSGIQIPMMEIPTIYKKAREAHLKGEDVERSIIDYVNSIRIN